MTGMSLAPEKNFKRIFYKTVALASLAVLPLYVIFWTSYLSLTDEMPWWNVLTLNIAAILLGVLLLLFYFRTIRTGIFKERLRLAGGSSMAKGVLMASFGLIATSLVLAMLSVTAFFWVASYTPYTSETSQFYEVVSRSNSGRRGRTVQLVDMRDMPVHVRFGPWTWGAAGLEEGDRIHILCKGYETFCRVIEWREL